MNANRSSRSHCKADNVTPFAEVAVGAAEVRGARTFHYAVPRSLNTRLLPGQLVLVEFGRRTLHGIVMNICEQSPIADPKPILDIIWDTPFLDRRRLEFARWIAERFGISMANAVESLLPANIARYITFSYVPRTDIPANLSGTLTRSEQRALERLRAEGPMSTAEVAASIGKTFATTGLPRMVKSGWLHRWTELELPMGGARCATLSLSLQELDGVLLRLRGAPKQQALLKTLSKLPGPVPVKNLLKLADASRSSLNALERAGYVRTSNIYCVPEPPSVTPADVYTHEADDSCWRSLEAFLDRGGHAVCVLLGRPEARILSYVQAIEKTLAAGRQVLILCPTEREGRSLYERIASTLSGMVALSADARTPGSRVGLWRATRAGEIDVYIGTRSAVFAPLGNLGLIIVDREEDRLFKASSGARVQGRDAAIEVGRSHLCPVVLGTTTPAVETFYNIESERYRFILMDSDHLFRKTRMKVGRGWGALGPAGTVHVVDMRAAPLMGQGGMLSEKLFISIKEKLAAGGKAVLLVNRRGAASMTICRECGFVFNCPDCDTRLVQHQSIESLVCHSCNYRQIAPQHCPECSSSRLRLWGHGTESIVQSLKALLPFERIDRIDSTVPSDRVKTIAEGFRRGSINVLVGTSLLFSQENSLTADLLGIVQADIGLTFPDYTAPERVFQMLMRLRHAVLGGDMDGLMLIQTLMPSNHVVEAARIGSYLKFFRSEISIRKEHDFPPFSRLIRFIYSNRAKAKAREQAGQLMESLTGVLAAVRGNSVRLMGPAPCFRARERGVYRWHILAYGPEKQISELLTVPHRGWIVDTDPVDLV